MLDPFPIPATPAIRQFFTPLAERLNFTTLPLHAHEILFFALFYQFVCAYASPTISTRLFPTIYPSLNKKTKLNWDVHVVSLVQCTGIVAYAFYLMANDKERSAMTQNGWEERVFGYTGATALLVSMASGYFLWDLILCTRYIHVFGPGLLAHAISAFTVYVLGYRPYVNYYATVFILYECSSPFLNFHWFFDKVGMTGTTAQLINGIVLIGTFFGARLVWGIYGSFCVFLDMYHAYNAGALTSSDSINNSTHLLIPYGNTDPELEVMFYSANQTVPLWLPAAYLSANLVLNGLNIYWFGKMIETIRKRFDPPLGTKGVGEKGVPKIHVDSSAADTNGEVIVQRGVDAAGRKSVEVESTTVRQRPPIQRADFSVSTMM